VAIMEAMAAGIPVVAAAVGGVPDLVADDQSGVLVPPGDPGALAGAIESLRRDPLRRRRFGAAGRERIFMSYELDTVVARYDHFYRELLAEARGA